MGGADIAAARGGRGGRCGIGCWGTADTTKEGSATVAMGASSQSRRRRGRVVSLEAGQT